MGKLYKFQSLEKEKLAWLAGIFQAEAYFYLDERVRSVSNDPNYTPPSPVPSIRLEMIEKDLMEHVGDCLDQSVKKQVRQTSAGNHVYRISLASRPKVKAFLTEISPFVVGHLKRSKIQELLYVCEQYDQWVELGGRSKAASLSARMKAQKSK